MSDTSEHARDLMPGVRPTGAAVVAGSLVARWQRLSTRRKVSAAVFVALLLVVAAVSYMANSDGITVVDDATNDVVAYVSICRADLPRRRHPHLPRRDDAERRRDRGCQRQARPRSDHRHGCPGSDPGRLGALLAGPALLRQARGTGHPGQGQQAGADGLRPDGQEPCRAHHRGSLRAGHALRRERDDGLVGHRLSALPGVVRDQRHPVEHLHLHPGVRDRSGTG